MAEPEPSVTSSFAAKAMIPLLISPPVVWPLYESLGRRVQSARVTLVYCGTRCTIARTCGVIGKGEAEGVVR